MWQHKKNSALLNKLEWIEIYNKFKRSVSFKTHTYKTKTKLTKNTKY